MVISCGIELILGKFSEVVISCGIELSLGKFSEVPIRCGINDVASPRKILAKIFRYVVQVVWAWNIKIGVTSPAAKANSKVLVWKNWLYIVMMLCTPTLDDNAHEQKTIV